jgi:peptidyl-prolyl cis-trans isomerase D
MLEVFRNAAKGWVAKILLGLLVISFAVWGITDVFTGFQSQDLVTVGKTKIAAETYQRDLNNTMQRLSQQTGKQITLEEARSIGLTQQVLDRLIATSSIDELGDKMGLQVGDQAIALAVQSNPMFSGADGKFSKDRFDAILRQNNMTEPVYLASERQNTLRASIAGAANANIALPKTLGEALFKYPAISHSASAKPMCLLRQTPT